MLKKLKQTISMLCALIFILPSLSYSIDKEEFLKFLIDSSYPESSIDNDESEKKVDKEKETSNINEKEDDYIKFHIGEENVPVLKKEEKVSTENIEYKKRLHIIV